MPIIANIRQRSSQQKKKALSLPGEAPPIQDGQNWHWMNWNTLDT